MLVFPDDFGLKEAKKLTLDRKLIHKTVVFYLSYRIMMNEVEIESTQQAMATIIRWTTTELTMTVAKVLKRISVMMLMIEAMSSFSLSFAFFTRPDITSASVRKIIGTTKLRTKAAAHFEKC